MKWYKVIDIQDSFPVYIGKDKQQAIRSMIKRLSLYEVYTSKFSEYGPWWYNCSWDFVHEKK